MNEYEELARLTAEATGKIFYIGVRPYDKGWFASCDGTEWDGDSPATAVHSVIKSLAQKFRAEAFANSANAKSLEQKAVALAETAALILPNDEYLD